MSNVNVIYNFQINMAKINVTYKCQRYMSDLNLRFKCHSIFLGWGWLEVNNFSNVFLR